MIDIYKGNIHNYSNHELEAILKFWEDHDSLYTWKHGDIIPVLKTEILAFIRKQLAF